MSNTPAQSAVKPPATISYAAALAGKVVASTPAAPTAASHAPSSVSSSGTAQISSSGKSGPASTTTAKARQLPPTASPSVPPATASSSSTSVAHRSAPETTAWPIPHKTASQQQQHNASHRASGSNSASSAARSSQHRQQGHVEDANFTHPDGPWGVQYKKQLQQSLPASSKAPSATSLVSSMSSSAAVAPSAVERDRSAESFAALCSSLEQLEPRSVALGLQPQHMLGVAVQELSVAQLQGLTECAFALIRKINVEMGERARQLERSREREL